ncbi:MAG: hypothetical protein PHC34_12225 [Candidatus Gastranaerophilales bacterium]|nr:hypothetical protein [Candidatus Gastranaerophilales bacterium]
MKRKIVLLSLVMLLTSNGLSYAETDNLSSNDQNISNIKIAVVGEIVKDAVKQGFYSFGTMMLNRYTNPNATNVYYNPYSTPTYSTTTTTQPTNTTTTQTEFIPDQPEPMIPVS